MNIFYKDFEIFGELERAEIAALSTRLPHTIDIPITAKQTILGINGAFGQSNTNLYVMKGHIISRETMNIIANMDLTIKSLLVPSIVKPEKKQFRNGAESSAKNKNHAKAYPQRPVWIADICPIRIVKW